MTYADDDGAKDFTIRASKQRAQIHTLTGLLGDIPKFGFLTYTRDPSQRQPMYIDKDLVEQGIKFDILDFHRRDPEVSWTNLPAVIVSTRGISSVMRR